MWSLIHYCGSKWMSAFTFASEFQRFMFLEDKDYIVSRERHILKISPYCFQRVRIQFLMFEMQNGSLLCTNVTGQVFIKLHLQTFGIYIVITFSPIPISILKALRNLIVEKPIYLCNTTMYDFFDFRSLLSSMPINKICFGNTVIIINFFSFCGFHYIFISL